MDVEADGCSPPLGAPAGPELRGRWALAGTPSDTAPPVPLCS